VSKTKKTEELQEDQIDEQGSVNSPSSASEELDEQAEVQEEKSLEDQLLDALAEAADLRDKVLRVAADSENFKKRMERERATMLKYSGEAIFRELLPVVDNLERAVEQGVIDGAGPEQNLQALLEGVQLTLKSLVNVLEKFEVKPVASVGERFDPTVQEALSMEPSDTVPQNCVITEFEKGYHYKDRLLRAARVVVSAGDGGA
jgi:molecular chaperone GrpE